MSQAAPPDFSQWREALAGGKPATHPNPEDAWCGYFAVQDRSSKVKAAKWPTIAGAIWRDENGALKAERGGQSVPVEWLWPFCASRPITYERYQFWHEHKSWPEEAEAA